jgi:hypothetical protein
MHVALRGDLQALRAHHEPADRCDFRLLDQPTVGSTQYNLVMRRMRQLKECD